jgi:hypothetical protein
VVTKSLKRSLCLGVFVVCLLGDPTGKIEIRISKSEKLEVIASKKLKKLKENLCDLVSLWFAFLAVNGK